MDSSAGEQQRILTPVVSGILRHITIRRVTETCQSQWCKRFAAKAFQHHLKIRRVDDEIRVRRTRAREIPDSDV